MYLSWTDDVPIMYPLYICATGNVQDECLTLVGGFMSGPESTGTGVDQLHIRSPSVRGSRCTRT
jgi:hypothetical protein